MLKTLKATSVVMLLSLVLAVAGCSGTAQPSESAGKKAAVKSGGPGRYVLVDENSGAKIVATVPATTDDEDIAKLESWRQAARAVAPADFVAQNELVREPQGDGPVSYVLVETDNTDGTKLSQTFSLRIVTDEGEQVSYQDFGNATTVFFNAFNASGQGYDLQQQFNDWSNSDAVQSSAMPGAKAKTIYVSAKVPTSIKSVWIDNRQMTKE